MLNAFQLRAAASLGLALWLALLAACSLSGCRRETSSRSLSGPVSITSSPALPDETDPPPSVPALDDAIPLSAIACLTDEHGNSVKAIVRSASASLLDLRGNVAGSLPLMSKRYVFGSQGDNRLTIGSDPRGKADGLLAVDDAITTGSMQWLRFLESTFSLRQPVPGYAALKDIESQQHGAAVDPVLTEVQLGGQSRTEWMPILATHEIRLDGKQSLRVLEIAAWTVDAGGAARSVPAGDRGVDLPIEASLRKADLVLVVDVTASMTPAWEALCSRLKELVRALLGSGIDVRVAIVAYRDNDARSGWPMKVSPFTADLDLLEKWFGRLRPVGGGDDPELLFEAVQRGVDKLVAGDEAALRSILVITDAPGHVADSAGPPEGALGPAIVERCQQHGISVSSLQIPYHEKFSGEPELLPNQLEYLASGTEGVRFELEQDEGSSSQADGVVVEFSNWLLKEVRGSIEEEVFVAQGLEEGKPLDQLGQELNLPPTALKWRVENVARRLGKRLQLDGAGITLGVDRCFVIWDANSMEAGVLVRDVEWNAMVSVIDRLVSRGIEKPESLAEIWELLAGNSLGEEITLAEALRAEGIPVRGTGLLAITASELIASPRSARLAWAKEVEARFEGMVAWRAANLPDSYGNLIVPVSIFP